LRLRPINAEYELAQELLDKINSELEYSRKIKAVFAENSASLAFLSFNPERTPSADKDERTICLTLIADLPRMMAVEEQCILEARSLLL
jgi:hypothetical protein